MERINVQIVVKDMRFFKYIETCLKFLGSGSYLVEENTIKLIASPLHRNLPEEFITNCLANDGYRKTEDILTFKYQ